MHSCVEVETVRRTCQKADRHRRGTCSDFRCCLRLCRKCRTVSSGKSRKMICDGQVIRGVQMLPTISDKLTLHWLPMCNRTKLNRILWFLIHMHLKYLAPLTDSRFSPLAVRVLSPPFARRFWITAPKVNSTDLLWNSKWLWTRSTIPFPFAYSWRIVWVAG